MLEEDWNILQVIHDDFILKLKPVTEAEPEAGPDVILLCHKDSFNDVQVHVLPYELSRPFFTNKYKHQLIPFVNKILDGELGAKDGELGTKDGDCSGMKPLAVMVFTEAWKLVSNLSEYAARGNQRIAQHPDRTEVVVATVHHKGKSTAVTHLIRRNESGTPPRILEISPFPSFDEMQNQHASGLMMQPLTASQTVH